jgi:molybdopterin molybdotransferase
MTFAQAQARVLESAPKLSTERVMLYAAVDRVLAETIVSTVNLPGFDYSAMDGYALAAADLESTPTRALPITCQIAAGATEQVALSAASCARIFTGAPIPKGADCVEMQERVTVQQGDAVDLAVFSQPVVPGQHIRRAGEDLSIGSVALASQTRLRPEHLALLTALGRVRVSVTRRPVVTILSTGDELREPEDTLRPGSVIECISPTIAALATQCGATVRIANIVRDEQALIERALAQAVQESDLVITVGGVSVGDHDLVRPALEKAGVTLDFWRVAIKPGKPVALGHCGPHRWLGLPGNPASAVLTFMLFGAPLLRAMPQDAKPLAARVRAPLAKSVRHATGRLEFLRANLQETSDMCSVEVLAGQASGSVVSLAHANALVLLDAELEQLAAGSLVEVIRMRDI